MRTDSRPRTLSTVVVVAVFLGLVGSASAEGVWVLWSETTNYYVNGATPTPPSWTRASAHSSSQECERHVRDLMSTLPTEYQWVDEGVLQEVRVRALGDKMLGLRLPDGVVAVIRYSCWPETIDPRK